MSLDGVDVHPAEDSEIESVHGSEVPSEFWAECDWHVDYSPCPELDNMVDDIVEYTLSKPAFEGPCVVRELPAGYFSFYNLELDSSVQLEPSDVDSESD